MPSATHPWRVSYRLPNVESRPEAEAASPRRLCFAATYEVIAALNDAVAVSLNAAFCRNQADNMSWLLKSREHLVCSPRVAAIFSRRR